MDMNTLSEMVRDTGLQCFVGYPPSNAKVPYVTIRPLVTNYEGELAISGDAIGWDHQVSLYCAAGSVEASDNLAKMVMSALAGKRAGDSVLAVSMGYAGAPVEGHYETQVTAQAHQGGI
ncbi:hypothetical protein FDJ44_gp11 [Microbacterium phage Pikmin]|uniref:Tail terminator n=3 Tax=Pikminvirus pikmin TaxID=2560596 RepID=A0A2P1CKC4_9CAUD|nr:hypothetical protein FDJ44_gp11 [Microbacterium phage Pikmin]AVJ51002.1 tail terminator [Microbacterium phage Pajaza]AVJ51149.1 tail terminator [Microbacterium phage Pikmin]AVJ51707.1 tail terminator [Microbacterium phage Casey]